MGTRGVVLVDHGSRRDESNRAFESFVSRFAEVGRYAIVEPAHMEIAEPSIAQAFAACVERGATEVVVCPFFLLPGKHWSGDIPRLTREAAAEYPEVSSYVSAPIGGHELLIDLLTDRIERCRQRLDGEVGPCDVCTEQTGCRWLGCRGESL